MLIFILFGILIILGLGYLLAKENTKDETKDLESIKQTEKDKVEKYMKKLDRMKDSNNDLYEERKRNGYYDVNTSDM